LPPKHIVIATIGSLGDLHPCLALGLELKRRGYRVTIVSSHFYRAKVEELGFSFHAMRPHWKAYDEELIRRCSNMKRAPEVLMRELILPELRGTYEDLLAVARGADLLIAGEIVYPVPILAEQLGKKWVSVILSPSSFFSAHDPSVLVPAPWFAHLRRAGWLFNRLVITIGSLSTRHWWKPVRDLRRELGLRQGINPLFNDKFSPDLVLALFSRALALPQRDWPASTLQPGFVFYDRASPGSGVSDELREFLAAGEPPIIFTLGSTAVHHQGDFAEVSAQAAKLLGHRAVLLLGKDAPPANSSPDVLAVPYAPYSEVFPRAAAIVHQGGSGTTGQGMLAGRPMLIVPYGWDQPDNAERIQRLGSGLHLPRTRYTAENTAAALKRLIEEPSFARRAAELASILRTEHGLVDACNAIETLL
jgi:UDP:flavonoid glycosyltransferase YjiC (YdhE family)